ncbi:MAG: hypothetical protein ACK4SF_05940 [Algoriphagus aquaeductus]|uniref:hypothetical protein n=1 Tax=Algoriphagus aquaeductus TaxID=475299 RepID=UPI00391D2758
MSLIKDDKLVKKTTTGKKTVYTLKNLNRSGKPTKLGDVFNHLPSGIVIKSETGMGATTLEIGSMRNSIIVEPLRFTAESKALKHNCFFVGTSLKKKDAVDVPAIRKYLTSPPTPLTPFKKILCVVDSLYKVLEAISEEGLALSDFFLVLDETDSLQLDSSFRKIMNQAFEDYKKFPQDSRATVTATPIEFSDPDLSLEKVTEIKYKTSSPREVALVRTPDYKGQLADEIMELLENHPGEKIFVALNSVKAIKEVAYHLEEKKGVNSSSFKILCSTSSKTKAGKRFSEIENEKLPGLINFLTAAYFTGFDIDEPYHLLVAISAGSQTLELSELRYKQIAGRCRKKLLSEKIVYEGEGHGALDVYDFPTLSKMAEEEITSINCFSRTYGAGEDQIRNHMLKIRSSILESRTVNGSALVFEDLSKELKKAYTAFDGILESSRLRKEVFPITDGLKKGLEAIGFNVVQTDSNPSGYTGNSRPLNKSSIEELEIIDEVLKNYQQFGIPFSSQNFEGFTKVVLELVEQYKNKVDENYLIKRVQIGYSTPEGGMKRLKNLKLELEFACAPDTEFLKVSVTGSFNIGNTYTKDELTKEMSRILKRNSISMPDDQVWRYVRRVFTVKQGNGTSNYKLQKWVVDPKLVKK